VKVDPADDIAVDRGDENIRDWSSLCRSNAFSWSISSATLSASMYVFLGDLPDRADDPRQVLLARRPDMKLERFGDVLLFPPALIVTLSVPSSSSIRPSRLRIAMWWRKPPGSRPSWSRVSSGIDRSAALDVLVYLFAIRVTELERVSSRHDDCYHKPPLNLWPADRERLGSSLVSRTAASGRETVCFGPAI